MRLIALSISALLLVASACSDDTQAPKPDQKLVPLEAGPKTDKTLVVDGKPATDGVKPATDGVKPATDGTASKEAGAALSCGGATDAAQTCTKACPTTNPLPCLVKCNDDARKSACATGQVLFDKLVTCISTTCIGDCMAGATPACETCTKTKCKTDYDACYAHKC